MGIRVPIAFLLACGVAALGCRVKSTTELIHVDVELGDDRSGDGIEPYFAVIVFESTVGKPDSTSSEFIDSRVTLATANLGPTSPLEPVPTEHPAQSTSFTLAGDLADAEAAVTEGITITGRVIVGLEEDNRGWDPCCGFDGIRDTLQAVSDDLAVELAILESVVWSPLVIPAFVLEVQTFVETAIRQLPGQGRSDDLLDIHIVVNVHATPGYYSELRAHWNDLEAPDCDGAYALLAPMSGQANYYFSVCPSNTHELDLRFDAGQAVPTYFLRIRHAVSRVN